MKNIHIWLPSYIMSKFSAKERPVKGNPIHVVFCIVDHFEPGLNNASFATMKKRVSSWVANYPEIADRHRDFEGHHPKHTFFYPIEQYHSELLSELADLCNMGYGDVEVHLHHHNDTDENTRAQLLNFKEKLRCHGLLHEDNDGNITYGFIHGNWALDNSRKDGKWCGVNNELIILRETGCYADFTLPSAPSDTQTYKINSIYYASDIPDKPKSHNTGIDVAVGNPACGDLMIIQGPLTLNWKNRKYGVLPRIENAEITDTSLPTKDRVDLWIKQNIHVKGEPNWIFVKVHTHGCREANTQILLGGWLDKMYEYLEYAYNDGERYQLHYMTAREVYLKINEIRIGQSKVT